MVMENWRTRCSSFARDRRVRGFRLGFLLARLNCIFKVFSIFCLNFLPIIYVKCYVGLIIKCCVIKLNSLLFN